MEVLLGSLGICPGSQGQVSGSGERGRRRGSEGRDWAGRGAREGWEKENNAW
jgi:hypothetical protein